jgi:hypothetical protein
LDRLLTAEINLGIKNLRQEREDGEAEGRVNLLNVEMVCLRMALDGDDLTDLEINTRDINWSFFRLGRSS